MGNILDKIFEDKKTELDTTKRGLPISELKEKIEERDPVLDVTNALDRSQWQFSRVITEIKRRTPFKGELCEGFDHLKTAMAYMENGAAAMSVLTESKYFGGSIDFLLDIKKNVDVPLLRKDFIFAEYQVYEARAFGGDFFLLIATYLEKNHLSDLLELGKELGMLALVETHHEKDLERAFQAGATLIGINNRDLNSGKTDLGISRRLLKMARVDPKNILICESGIHNREEIEDFEKQGAHAFLIGESLMRSDNIPNKLQELSGKSQDGKTG